MKDEAPTSPKDAALRLALEALKHGGCPPDCKDGMTDSGGVHPWGEAALIPCPNCKTIAACEKALEQPEPEPVAWMDIEDGIFHGLRYWSEPDNRNEVALYTSPPKRKWQGLTDEEKVALCKQFPDHLTFNAIHAIEAKLKEKNT
jgi:hypothetical protein